ncbi:hypothetical protein ASG35_18365 [Burkholderia sp. Leaf177]|nr:hypothetical protein ASG35_18365 [Burkholderia sp. Leaf177]
MGSAGAESQIVNVKAGTSLTDAVNMAQLKALGMTTDAGGTITNAFVAYDSANKNTIKLGGTAGTKLSNVAAGILSATSMDAVNGSQLFALTDGTSVTNSAYMRVMGAGNGSDNASIVNAVNSIAIGSRANIQEDPKGGANHIAIGTNATALGNANEVTATTVVGSNALAKGASSAFGSGASANSTYSVAIGANSLASVGGATAVGSGAQSVGYSSLAIGATSKASNDFATAIGGQANATAPSSVALGTNSVADRYNTVSVGAAGSERQIVNLKAGTSSTDAVNVSQLTALGMTTDESGTITNAFVAYDDTNKNTIKLGGTAGTKLSNVAAGILSATSMDAVNGSQLFALTDGTSVTNSAYMKVTGAGNGSDNASIVNATSSIAIGSRAKVQELPVGGSNHIAIGTNATVIGNTSPIATTVVGSNAVGYSASSVFGSGATANSNYSVAIGANSLASVGASVAVGIDTKAVGYSAVAFGSGSTASTDHAVAIGGNALVTAGGSVALGYNSVADRFNTVSVGAAGSERQIVNLKAGTSSTDAVNVSQLTALGMTTDESGTITNAFVAYDDTNKDTIKLGGSAGTIIGNVKAGVEQSDAVNVAQLNAAGLVIGSDGAVSNAFVAYDDTLKDTITLGGTDGTIIGNVKAGALTPTSMEAINGSQLFDTSTRMAAMLGGGASVNAMGALLAPTYKVGGAEVHDVGSAIGNLDGRVTQNSSDIAGILGTLASGSGSTPNPNPDPNPNPNPSPNPDPATTNPTPVNRNALVYDSADRDQVTLGGFNMASAPVRLSNVAAGELSTSSTDAINGAQLNTTNGRLSATENAIAGYQAAGLEFVMVNSPTDSGSKPSASGQDSIAIGSNAQAAGNNSIAIGAHSVADDPNTVSVGSADNERRVTNVAAGTKGTDAANVNQLNKLRDDVGSDMRSLQRAAFSGVAAAMAMPNLMPSAPGKTVMAAGVGNFKGYGAFGAGATYRSGDGKWLVNGAVSLTGNGDAGMRAQVGYEF